MAYASVSALRELSTDERETILGDDKPAGWASVILGAGDDGEKCDRLAGNPFDRQKLIGQGVFLRDIEPEAVNVCDAASQAHPQEPRYLYQLGRALEKVKRIPEATDRYQRAADLGYARAFYNLGTMYKIGPKRDLKVAIDNYHKAWSLDVVTAAAQLASIFLNGGEGVSADPQKALEWLHLGIKAGDSNSHREIALLHQKGDHVKRNLEMALFHHIIAMLIFEGQRNPEFSKHEVGSLARSLPKADVLRIDREARDWLAARPKTLP